METKICSRCKENKEADEKYFGLTKRSADGFLWWCRECCSAYGKEYRKKETQRTKDQYNKRKQTYRLTPKGMLSSKVQMLRIHNLSLDQYNILVDKQRGCCAICGDSLVKPTSVREPHVDHNHDTGHVRGILCRGCNQGLGGLKDDPDTCIKAATYLLSRGYYG